MGSTDPIVGLLPILAAVAVAVTVRTRPLVAFTVLFVTASLSRATFETPVGTMRPEMPATLVAVVLLLRIHGIKEFVTPPRNVRLVAIGFAAYLVAIAVSSALVAVDRRQSLLMVAWLASSMGTGVVAFHLLRPRPTEAIVPFSLSGALMGSAGIGAAIVFLAAGPGAAPGIQDPMTEFPRVYGLAWETNLYASFLAITSFFALELVRRRRDPISVSLLAVLLIGFPLGITRGAWIALGAGAAVFALVWLRAQRSVRPIGPAAAGAACGLGIGLVLTALLLPGASTRALRDTVAQAVPSPVLSSPVPQGQPSARVSPAGPSVAPSPSPRPVALPDTLAFRLERVPIALGELPQSPLIGFGAESFGQRHPDRYAGSGPDHIAIMAVVVLYEAGLAGVVALILGFGALVIALLRLATMRRGEAEMAELGAGAAFLGSLTTMLVAYQVTNSLQMAINWMIIGAAAALAAGRRDPGSRTRPGSTNA